MYTSLINIPHLYILIAYDYTNNILNTYPCLYVGMSKLNPGMAPETMSEMMTNPDILKMITAEVNDQPQIVGATDQFGEAVSDYNDDEVIRRMQDAIDSQSFEGIKEIPDEVRQQVKSKSTTSAATTSGGGQGYIDAEFKEEEGSSK